MGRAYIIFCVLFLSCLCVSVFSQNDVAEDTNKLSRASAHFADKLYKQLSRNSTNLIFSPLSISAALSMLTVGAAGRTAEELNATLGFQFAQLNEQELLQGYQNMVTSLTEERDGYQFSLANAQFLQDSFPIYPNYTRIISEDFHALTKTVNFANKEETLAEINGWVSNATRGKISSILEEVTPLDVMALVNAVFFKGQWLYQFNEAETRDEEFYTANGTTKPVKIMSNQLPLNYKYGHEFGGSSVVELPYKGGFFSMYFVLPKRGETLEDLEEKMTPDVLLRLSDGLQNANVTVGVPRIKIESEIDLKSNLESIGVREVFTDHADLSGISAEELKVTQAKHKATIEINEEGSEAAAVTVVVTSTRIGNLNPTFWLNRPFMYILRHNPTNTVCFMGKISDV